MIPSLSFLEQDFEITEQPSYTHKMLIDNEQVRGYTDLQDAMKQAVYKILNTERYKYLIYSNNYGVEIIDLFGEPISYVCPELERRITEALTWDDRIQSVDNFEFDTSKKGVVTATFTVHTVFGDITAKKEVAI